MSVISRLGALATALLLFVMPARAGESRAAMAVGLRIIGAAPVGKQRSMPVVAISTAAPAAGARLTSGRSTVEMRFGGLSSGAWMETRAAARGQPR